MNWIKCSDRLPEYDKYVFVAYKSRGGVACLQEYNKGNDDYWQDGECRMYDKDEITHWAPIELPEDIK